MPKSFCIKCNGWRDSWYDACGERCANECRERCSECNRFFNTGELTRPSTYNVPILSDSHIRSIQTNIDTMIERSGGKNEYEYKIEVKTERGYTVSQIITGRRR